MNRVAPQRALDAFLSPAHGDHPDLGLSSHLEIGPDPALDERIGLIDAGDQRIARWIIEGAFRAFNLERRGLSYSRSAEWHLHARRAGWPASLQATLRVVTHLEKSGLIASEVAAACPSRAGPGFQSWLELQPCFLAWLDRRGGVLGIRHHHPQGLVRLRDRVSGRPLPLKRSRFVRDLERQMMLINESVQSASWRPSPGDVRQRRGDLVMVQGAEGAAWLDNKAPGHAILLTETGSVRAWSFGRMHGWGFQSAPKAVRRRSLISDQATGEVDFVSLHPRLAFRFAGQIAPSGDLYMPIVEVTGEPRSLVKVAVNVGLNARSNPEALGAIAWTIAEMEGSPLATRTHYGRARRMLQALNRVYPSLGRLIGADAGVHCMRIESTIMRAACLRLARLGVVFGPLHDSLVVAANDVGHAQQALAAASFDELGVELPTSAVVA